MNQPINQLTNKYQSTNFRKFDIHDRIFQFVVDGLRIIRIIPKSLENKTIIDQLIRSMTSMGANDQEADGVSTKRDFIHCFTVVRKEAKETFYWLKLLGELNPTIKIKINMLLQENKEIINIVSTIIKNSVNKRLDN